MQAKHNFFEYGDTEINYLKSKDKVLATVIDTLGKLERKVTPDLFTALIHTIVGQQISVKAQATIWQRLQDKISIITPQTIANHDADVLQQLGLSHRKVGYMQEVAHKILQGDLDLQALYAMSDEQVITELSKLRGIGVWSAEMLMLFSIQRCNILSYGDLAILRGLRMLHRHRKITPTLFAKYQRRYAPYGSVASLYLWAIAGGAIPHLVDLQTKKPVNKNLKVSTRLKIITNQQGKKQIKNENTQRKENIIHREFYNSPLGILEIRAVAGYISHVQFVDKSLLDEKMVDEQVTDFAPPNDVTAKAINQLTEYFAGERREFDLPIKQQGTDFQQHVWQALSQLKYGTTVSYKEVAEKVGNIKASRAVGMANNRNRIAIIVPCHRVIGSNGKLVGYAGGLDVKQSLIEREQSRKYPSLDINC